MRLPLQDNVPAFESAQAIAIVERNLGAPILTKFESFDPTPIAAASLGQVREPSRRGDCWHHLRRSFIDCITSARS